MKKTVAAIALIVAVTVGIVGIATTATAVPTKKISCSPCHKKTTKITITTTATAEATNTVTYSVKITGGKGKAGWAVFSGKKNIARKKASSGTFTLTRGKTYKVWAVKKSTGARFKTLVVPPFVPPIVP